MLKLMLLNCCLVIGFYSTAKTIVVKNIAELNNANKMAQPGDIVELQNGEWNQVNIALDCNGTKDHPIIFKAQTAGKVLLTGHSNLKLGGNYIIVDGFYFVNGYAGNDAVIKFCIDKKTIANNCRVTNTVITDFNNPKRMDENYWIAFYGKNNRVDHGSFLNKKNMGVLLAVIMDDERSRESFHSIDHNYFGVRLPLASNSGEIIRVGVSQHCEFNSNTQITDNYFENCDGEAEVISIKSCRNIIRNNLFKECQGAVVLRHGNYNTVENNVFIGNNKRGTGGVRIINKGQWVVNNYFYKCLGEGFRAPLSIMNGVPNSPAFRYVGVTDAVVANNSFFECSPFNFCLGSDAERTETPRNVQFLGNIFYNSRDGIAYISNDNISGIQFTGNPVSNSIQQGLTNGFVKTSLTTKQAGSFPLPNSSAATKLLIPDSIQSESQTRLSAPLSSTPGFSDEKRLLQIGENARSGCGAKWFGQQYTPTAKKEIKVDCKTAADIVQQVNKNQQAKLIINLTGTEYNFTEPVNIVTDILITTAQKTAIHFAGHGSAGDFIFQMKAGKTFAMRHLKLNLDGVKTNSFISTDTSQSCNHSSFILTDCEINNTGGQFFKAALSSVADSIIINNCSFNDGKGMLFNFMAEVDKKGYYNVEQLKITNNAFNNFEGPLLAMLRGGNDESTMGPNLIFAHNKINNCDTKTEDALVSLNGTQRTVVEKNSFVNCNSGETLIHYQDLVSAVHLFSNNVIKGSGNVIEDKFVKSSNNTIQ